MKFEFLALAAIAGLVIYCLGWIGGFRFRKGWGDFIAWMISGLVYGALVGLGALLFILLQPYQPTSNKLSALLVSLTFGVPWVLLSQMIAEIVFVGLSSYERDGDADREWLGRAAGWVAAAAVAWALIAFLVFDGGYFVLDGGTDQLVRNSVHQAIVAAGGITGILSGIVTALLGSSAKTPAKPSSKDQTSTALVYDLALAVAGPLFVACLIIALSVGIDRLLLGDSLVAIMQKQAQSSVQVQTVQTTVSWLVFGTIVVVALGGLASCFVNINRFSLHALYRNRLVRAYLGASNQERKPDLFSGFDFGDNIRVHRLWSDIPSGNKNRLFHVINIALNVVSTKRLAWQERKAESFTASPLHCGSAYLGFRPSTEYGDGPKNNEEKIQFAKGEREFGIALGTAMAISGAAVSPNMGYHSSPSIALLLTLFNVRLGWWLGNPGKAGDKKKTYKEDGPKSAGLRLFAEAFGLTTDTSPYVYLSDGGHFENLGLYEMVRRRCRFIVVIDAGCDPDFAFEDLGNAVRKIYIDLGIRITFDGLGGLQNRPSARSLSRAMRDAAAAVMVRSAGRSSDANKQTPDQADTASVGIERVPYCAIGTIDYADADNTTHDDHTKPAAKNGWVLYIKPAYHGIETSAGIRSYARANPEFPHETTADQWFSESQFESYRSLGLDIGRAILTDPKAKAIVDGYLASALHVAATAATGGQTIAPAATSGQRSGGDSG